MQISIRVKKKKKKKLICEIKRFYRYIMEVRSMDGRTCM